MIRFFKNLPPWLRLGFVFPLLFLNGFLLVLLINYLEPLISFLIIAAILAFLLELLIELLVQKGIQRNWAITTVLSIALISIVLLGLILLPVMVEQLNQLITSAPQWIKENTEKLQDFAESPLIQRLPIDVNAIISELPKQLSKTLETVGTQMLSIILGTISTTINTLLVLVLTIFLLIGGDSFWHGLFSLLPAPWNRRIPEYLFETFKNYFFIRLILAGGSSVVRTIVFILLGIPYSLLFAFGIGIGNLIPFVSGVITLFGTVLLCFNDFWLGLRFLISAVIIDQITDNVISPRMLGDKIGINPIWLIIALFVGAKMGGILGLLLAVPVASVIKRIIDDLRSPYPKPEKESSIKEEDISVADQYCSDKNNLETGR